MIHALIDTLLNLYNLWFILIADSPLKKSLDIFLINGKKKHSCFIVSACVPIDATRNYSVVLSFDRNFFARTAPYKNSNSLRETDAAFNLNKARSLTWPINWFDDSLFLSFILWYKLKDLEIRTEIPVITSITWVKLQRVIEMDVFSMHLS